jgi:hypothetical protein
MAGSDGKRTGVLGRLREKRDSRRRRRAEKARVAADARREWERSGKSDPRAGNPGVGAGGI